MWLLLLASISVAQLRSWTTLRTTQPPLIDCMASMKALMFSQKIAWWLWDRNPSFIINSLSIYYQLILVRLWQVGLGRCRTLRWNMHLKGKQGMWGTLMSPSWNLGLSKKICNSKFLCYHCFIRGFFFARDQRKAHERPQGWIAPTSL